MDITEHIDDERTRAKEARGEILVVTAVNVSALVALMARAEQTEQEVARLRAALDEIDYELNANIDMRALGVMIPAVYRSRVAAAQALGKNRVCDDDMHALRAPARTETKAGEP